MYFVIGPDLLICIAMRLIKVCHTDTVNMAKRTFIHTQNPCFFMGHSPRAFSWFFNGSTRTIDVCQRDFFGDINCKRAGKNIIR